MPSHLTYRLGRKVVSDLSVHLVFLTKCRHGALSDRALAVLRTAMDRVCEDFGARLLHMDGADDHVHLVVVYPPQVAISRLVNSLKGVSARRLRKQAFSEVSARLDGPHLWSPSYFVASAGDAPEEKVRRYVEQQRQPPSKGREPSAPSSSISNSSGNCLYPVEDE